MLRAAEFRLPTPARCFYASPMSEYQVASSRRRRYRSGGDDRGAPRPPGSAGKRGVSARIFTTRWSGVPPSTSEGCALPPDTLEALRKIRRHPLSAASADRSGKRCPPAQQPERAALLPLRKHFGLFANLRPSVCYPALTHASPLRPDLVAGGFDILCVRELTGGSVLRPTQTHWTSRVDDPVAVDTMVYRRSEIERVARLGIRGRAGTRRRRLVSVDKANVLENGVLWRRTMNGACARLSRCGAFASLRGQRRDAVDPPPARFRRAPRRKPFRGYSQRRTGDAHGFARACCRARASDQRRAWGRRFGLYEPSGGSAPDIAGQGIANPIAQILSAALMLRYSLGEEAAARSIEDAVRAAIDDGFRTADIYAGEGRKVGTKEMGAAVVETSPGDERGCNTTEAGSKIRRRPSGEGAAGEKIRAGTTGPKRVQRFKDLLVVFLSACTPHFC